MGDNRRSFIQKITTASLLTMGSMAALANKEEDFFYEDITSSGADDEAYWKKIKKQFSLATDCINLNSGNISPAPKIVQQALIAQMEFCNRAPSLHMLRTLEQKRETLISNLANFAGCMPGEIIINRNASEGLQTIIFGLDLKKGDEIILSQYDYPHLINAWKQREIRDGVRLVWVDMQIPSADENYLINSFTSLFTSKTKLVNITHIINWNGQVTPVKKIIEAAMKAGIPTLVDAAHSFALVPNAITEYQCDYLVASLHKWMYGPLGTGLLYVKKQRIKELYPLFANSQPQSESMDKFTHFGTRPMYIDHAVNEAIIFNTHIGIAKKLARLQYLKNYWMRQAANIKGVQFQTVANNNYSYAIANVYIEGIESYKLDSFLFTNYKIHAVAINHEKINSVRITPNIFTTLKDLDILLEAIETFTKSIP